MSNVGVGKFDDWQSRAGAAPNRSAGIKVGSGDTAMSQYNEVTVNLGGSFTGNDTVTCIKIGSLVAISARNNCQHGLTSVAQSTAGIIPSGYRPLQLSAGMVYEHDTTNWYKVQISTAGTVILEYGDDAAAVQRSDGRIQWTLMYVP